MVTLATDTFNRANGGLGANWTTRVDYAAPAIVSNQCRDSAIGGGEGSAFYSGIAWPDDHYTQYVVIAMATSFASTQVGVRITNAPDSGYEMWLLNGPMGATVPYQLYQAIAGTFTDIGSGTTTFANNDVLRGEAQGTSIRLYRNSTLIISLTDSGVTSGGSPSLLAGVAPGGTITDTIIDTWEGGDFSFPPGLGPAGKMEMATQSAISSMMR